MRYVYDYLTLTLLGFLLSELSSDLGGRFSASIAIVATCINNCLLQFSLLTENDRNAFLKLSRKYLNSKITHSHPKMLIKILTLV